MKNLMGLVVLSILLAGCASTHARFGTRSTSIVGTWVGTGPGGNPLIYEFLDDGAMRWRMSPEIALEPLELRYRYDASVTPAHLDVWGFESGPLEGRALLGIVQFTGRNKLKLDFEPGPLDDDAARITQFGDGTSEFRRQE